VQIGRYQILDKLGSGGMGEVYRALAQGVDGFQKPVVIKRIHKHLADRPDLAVQFINEAKIAMGLSHGNVVQVLDLGKLDEKYYIALEYVDGRDLRDLIRRCRELQEWIPREIALYVISAVLGGLDYAHRRTDLAGKPLGIIHRDVTPANILCSFEGEVKLADFGIARALAQESNTMPGGVKGSLRYMSPEQATGRLVDQRSDLFSVGVNLYYLLCGSHPYGEDNVLAVAQRVRAVRFELPSERGVELPEELESIVLTAMAADPEDRYPTAAAMLTALEEHQRSVAHATGSDLRALMQRLFEPEGERRSWSLPSPPIEARDSLVGTEIEIAGDPGSTGSAARASERLRRALRVEGVIPRMPTRSDEGSAPLQRSPTASDSGSRPGRRIDVESAHSETLLDLTGGTGHPLPGAGSRPEIAPGGAAPVEAPPARVATFRETTSPTETVGAGRAKSALLVLGVALMTATLAVGGFLLARGERSPTPRAGPEPGPARNARLTVRSRPPGARVLLDGKPAGIAPVTLELRFGRVHRLALEKPAHRRWSEAVRLEADAPIRTMLVELAEEPTPTTPIPTTRPATAPARKLGPPPVAARGWVRVSTRPAWAEVHVGGRRIDVTPCRIRLPVGPQVVTLRNPGVKRTERRRIVVRADREVELLITDFK
jgi:serine/threonine protein kinase